MNAPGTLRLRSDPAEVASLLDWIDSLLKSRGVERMQAFRFRCAIVEVVNNCIQHAYRGRTGKPILIDHQLQAGRLAVTIRDRGRAFTPVLPPQAQQPLAESGRGLPIILAGADQVHFSRDGEWNACRLEIGLTPPAALPA